MEFQYNKELQGRFWEDYSTLDYFQFATNCHLLGGQIGEVINGRRYLLGEYSEAPKEFRIWATKHCMTPEIEEYRNKSKAEVSMRNMASRVAMLDNAAQANRERRLNEKKKAGFKSWR